MKLPALKKNQILLIHWLDAIFDEGWHRNEAYEHDNQDAEHLTVGKFIRGDKVTISVAQSWRKHGTTDYGIGEVMTIPVKMIQSVKVLKVL